MYIDVSRHSTRHSLMGTQGRRNDCHIGLGASHQEMDRCVLLAAEAADDARGLCAVMVLSVSGSLLQVSLSQFPEYALMGAFAVITVKTNHNIIPLFILFLYRRLKGLSLVISGRDSPSWHRLHSLLRRNGMVSCWLP